MTDQDMQFQMKRLVPFLTGIALFLGFFIGIAFVTLFNVFDTPDADVESSNQGTSISSESDLFDVNYLEKVLETIDARYIDDVEFNTDEVSYAMIKGFITSLEDPYTSFLDPDEAAQYLQGASGDFEGIGISLAFNGQNTYIESILQGYPAEAAGLLPNDIILAVDGEDVSSEFPAVVAEKIRGEEGTEVSIELFRSLETTDETLTISVERAFIDVDNISWERIDDTTVKIDIVQFSDTTSRDLNELWDNVVDEIDAEMGGDLQHIIVDLRGNPGGYVFSVRYILEEFLRNEQIIMRERSRTEGEQVYRDTRVGEFESEEIIVLVDEGSASAAEIFALGIQENDRGIIIGEETVGKGVEQELLTLDDGSMILLVFQEWLSPDGNGIQAESPVLPDIGVERTVDDFINKVDPQLDRALEEIQR